jgi:UDP-N-acetylmuramoyl-L-alanyl-D-glutamate--2,6-diaminopimelate ligase
MAEYFACKMILFNNILPQSAMAVVNSAIIEFAQIKEICTKRNLKIIEYGFKAHDLKLISIEAQKVRFEFCKNFYEFEISASGDFQAFNMLCALGNVLAKNSLSNQKIKNLLQNFKNIKSAKGRMQKVGELKNSAQIFIDFAHSPDALENVLKLALSSNKTFY